MAPIPHSLWKLCNYSWRPICFFSVGLSLDSNNLFQSRALYENLGCFVIFNCLLQEKSLVNSLTKICLLFCSLLLCAIIAHYRCAINYFTKLILSVLHLSRLSLLIKLCSVAKNMDFQYSHA